VRIEFPGRGHRDGDPFCLVDYFECHARGTCKSESDNEPFEGARYFLGLQEMLVYFDPWIARGHASIIMIGCDGVSLRRFESAGQRLLHTQTAAFCDCQCQLGLFEVDRLDLIGTFIRGPGWICSGQGRRGITVRGF